MSAEARWTRFGLRPFRPDGGGPYLERSAGELLGRYLEGEQATLEDPIAEAERGPGSLSDLPEGKSTVFSIADLAEGVRITRRSTISLLLRDDRVAGFWVRFGADYVVPGAVDAVQEPGVVAAAVAACRARTWRKTDPTTAVWQGGGWTWDLLLVLEWPGALLARGSDALHRELLGTSTPLPVGGSGLAVVHGRLQWTNLIDRATVAALTPAVAGDALGALLRGGQGDVALKGTDEPVAAVAAGPTPEPPPPEAPTDPVAPPEEPASIPFGLPDEPLEAEFGLPEDLVAEPRWDGDPTQRYEELPSRAELEAGDADLAGGAPAAWDQWLDALHAALPAASTGTAAPERRPIGGLVEVGEGPGSLPGRLLSGWVAEDLHLTPWGGPRDLDVRSSVPAETARNLSAWIGSAALLAAGWLLVQGIALLLTLPVPMVAASSNPVPIPIVSFCSESNPAFLEALSCWTERLAFDEAAVIGSTCDPANPLGGLALRSTVESPLPNADVRASYCGLLHRGPVGRSLADEALASACFQVLGEPDRYAARGSAARGGARADPQAFFFNPDLRIAELAALGESLAKDCDRCDRTARGRVRRLAVRTWISPALIEPLQLSALGSSDLDVCPAPHRAWDVEEGAGDDRFSYERYSAARFGPLAREAAGLVDIGPPSPGDAWGCYLSTLQTPQRPLLATGVPGLRLRSPGALDATGRRGLASQLGVHALLDSDPTLVGAGDAGHAACARLARAELAHVASPHPLFDGDADPMSLCGGVCAGYFGLAATPPGWSARAEDLRLCTAGAVASNTPTRLCRDSTLAPPRTAAERAARQACVPPVKDPSPLCRDALAGRSGELRPDWEGEAGLCGDDEGGVAAVESAAPRLRRGGAAGVLFESEEVVAAPVDHALPRMVSACAVRLLEQDMSSAGIPPLLPANIAPGSIARVLEVTAGRLAGTSVEQSSRRVCEEAGSYCSVAAALLVRRPDLLWAHASTLAGPGTAEDLAVAMGPLLERNYRSFCDDGSSEDELMRTSRSRCEGAWVDEKGHGDSCTAICESGAFGFRLAARHADTRTRLDAAFRLTTATHMCVGLADFVGESADTDLTWETACIEGLQARMEVAHSLLADGPR